MDVREFRLLDEEASLILEGFKADLMELIILPNVKGFPEKVEQYRRNMMDMRTAADDGISVEEVRQRTWAANWQAMGVKGKG